MASQSNTPSQSVEKIPATSESMTSWVDADVVACIREDVAAEDRTESRIIARVLRKHYQRRIDAKRRAAAKELRRAA